MKSIFQISKFNVKTSREQFLVDCLNVFKCLNIYIYIYNYTVYTIVLCYVVVRFVRLSASGCLTKDLSVRQADILAPEVKKLATILSYHYGQWFMSKLHYAPPPQEKKFRKGPPLYRTKPPSHFNKMLK